MALFHGSFLYLSRFSLSDAAIHLITYCINLWLESKNKFATKFRLKIHSIEARKVGFHSPAERAENKLGENEVSEGGMGQGLYPSLRRILD